MLRDSSGAEVRVRKDQVQEMRRLATSIMPEGLERSLTAEEFRHVQEHVRIGVQILSDLKKLHHVLPGVAHHHESLDGTGYPGGLAGEAIPLPARILAVADAFDAMSSSRPYRRRLGPAQVEAIFRRGAGVQWDPLVVAALLACRAELEQIRQKGLGESLHRVVDETLGRI